MNPHLRYDRRTGEVYYRRPGAARKDAYFVEALDPVGHWEPLAAGPTLKTAIANAGGTAWWLSAPSDRFRVRCPGGVVLSPPGTRARTQPQPRRDSAPRVTMSVPLPQPVRQDRHHPPDPPRYRFDRRRTADLCEEPPMTPSKHVLSRNGTAVGTFDDAAAAERARVIYSRCDPAGRYAVTGGGLARFARDGNAKTSDRDDRRTDVSAGDLGPPPQQRFTIECRDDDGSWHRIADSYDSFAEAQAEMIALAREEKDDIGDLRVVRLAEGQPDQLDDDGDLGDAQDPNLGRGGSYPDAEAPRRGHHGRPRGDGPKDEKEVRELVKFARERGVTDMATAWTMMTRGR